MAKQLARTKPGATGAGATTSWYSRHAASRSVLIADQVSPVGRPATVVDQYMVQVTTTAAPTAISTAASGNDTPRRRSADATRWAATALTVSGPSQPPPSNRRAMPSTAAIVTPRSSSLGREDEGPARGHRVAPARARPRRVEVRTWVFHAVANGLSRVMRSAGTSGAGPTGVPGSQAERSTWTIVREP